MEETSLVVLAAGIGSRYGGLKQVEAVGPHGETLLEYSIHDALQAGFGHVLLVVQEDQEAAFRDLLPASLVRDGTLAFVHQRRDDIPWGLADMPMRRKPWGTGHAVYAARTKIEGPFVVINADDYYGAATYLQVVGFLNEARSPSEQYALVGFRLDQTLSPYGPVHRGLCRIDAAGCMLDVAEHRSLYRHPDGSITSTGAGESIVQHAPDAIVSMNMWAFPGAFAHDLETLLAAFVSDPATDLARDEFYLPYAVDRVRRIQNVCVHVLRSTEAWMGVTYREDLPCVQYGIRARILRGQYPTPLWKGGP